MPSNLFQTQLGLQDGMGQLESVQQTYHNYFLCVRRSEFGGRPPSARGYRPPSGTGMRPASGARGRMAPPSCIL